MNDTRYTLIDEDGISHGSFFTYEEASKYADRDAPVCVLTDTGWRVARDDE